MSAPLTLLGQSGVRLELDGTVLYIDPYLTDHVFEVDQEPDLRRQVAIPMRPEEVTDATFVLVTHAHLDHCDPTTVAPIARASAGARVVCPGACRPILTDAGIAEDRLLTALETPFQVADGLTITAIPAAHTEVERDADGHLVYVGYLIDHRGRRYYHAGDTQPAEALIAAVRRHGPVDVAFLPVNERNFYRDRRGIIGNMSVREAFQLAEDIQAKVLIPIHWDMFAPNSVYPEEIQLLYDKMKPPFALQWGADAAPGSVD